MLKRAATHLRLVGTAAFVGTLAVVVWLVTRLIANDFSANVETTFVVGPPTFGFGLLGRFGVITLGRGVESMQAHLDIKVSWTEADVRRAMARVLGFGFGVMLGATAVGSVASAFVAA